VLSLKVEGMDVKDGEWREAWGRIKPMEGAGLLDRQSSAGGRLPLKVYWSKWRCVCCRESGHLRRRPTWSPGVSLERRTV